MVSNREIFCFRAFFVIETGEGEHHSKFENLGNRSPPMHHHGENLNGIKGSPPHKNDIQPRKEPKPGAKIVRWSDSINRPLEQVREFEIIPNERGLSRLISYLNQLIEIHNFVSLYSSLTPSFHGHINISPSHNKTNDAVVFEMTFLTFKISKKTASVLFRLFFCYFKIIWIICQKKPWNR